MSVVYVLLTSEAPAMEQYREEDNNNNNNRGGVKIFAWRRAADSEASINRQHEVMAGPPREQNRIVITISYTFHQVSLPNVDHR